MFASGTTGQGESRAPGPARGVKQARPSPLHPSPHPWVPGRKSPRATAAGFDFPPTTSNPSELNQRSLGGEGPGRGRPGRKRLVPSAAGGAGGCSAARGPRLPVYAPAGCFFPPEFIGPLGPMAHTPDGISCELRGKPRLALPKSPPGCEEVARPLLSASGNSTRKVRF